MQEINNLDQLADQVFQTVEKKACFEHVNYLLEYLNCGYRIKQTDDPIATLLFISILLVEKINELESESDNV